MLNRSETLNENGSQIELITKKENNMTIKKTKRIKLRHISWIIEFVKDRKEKGETVTSITYSEGTEYRSERFSFQKHNNVLELTPWEDKISSFETESESEFEGETVEVRKVYKFDAKTLDFIVHSKIVCC